MRTATQELAMAAYRRGAYRDAVSLFETALQEVETSEGWNDLGASQVACKLRKEAELSFRRALAIDAGNGQARLNLGVLLATLGRNAEALPVLKQHSDSLDSQGRAELAPLIEHCLKETRKLAEAGFDLRTRRARMLCAVTGFLENGFSEANAREAWTLFESLRETPGDIEVAFASIEPRATERIRDAQREIESVPPSHFASYVSGEPFDLLHAYTPLIPFPLDYGLQHQPMILTLTANDPAEGCSLEQLDELRHLIDFGRLSLVCQSAGSFESLDRRHLRVAAMIPPVMAAPPARSERRPPGERAGGFAVGFATAPLLDEHWESRGIPLLLELAALSPETQFFLAWRTSPAEIENSISARGLKNVTVMAGRLDMEDFYDRVDAMILPFGRPTGNHGCPLSAVEGMLRGKPTLATDFAGLAGWLRQEDAGVVVPATVQDLRQGLVRLQGSIVTLSQRAQSSAERYFDRASAVAAYRKVYAEALEKPKGPTLRDWEFRIRARGKELARGRPKLAAFYKQRDVAATYTKDRFSAPPFQQMEEQGRAAIQALIESRFGKRTDLDLLDLASGTGRLLPCLVPFGEVTALDSSNEMLEEGRRRNLSNVRFVQGDIFDYPLGAQFDVITCGRLLRHLEYPDRRLLYRRFWELLRTDGIAILEVPNRTAEYAFRDASGWENFLVYDVFWTITEFRKELNENGLELFSSIPVGAGLTLHADFPPTTEPVEYFVAFGRHKTSPNQEIRHGNLR